MTLDLVEAACGGDEDAFRRLIVSERRAIFAHCYRMLGSRHDADDALQETLLRCWRGLPRFERRSSFRNWLHRIATNVCLDVIARRPRAVVPLDARVGLGADEPGEPAADADCASPAVAVLYEHREAVELAIIASLHHLRSRQRAVLILRDVLGYSAKEVAHALGTSVASVNTSLHRAHKRVAASLSDGRHATLRSLPDRRDRAIAQRFSDAFERGDVETIVGLLCDDVATTSRRRSRVGVERSKSLIAARASPSSG